MACCILSGSPDLQKDAAARSSSRIDGNVETAEKDKNAKDARDKENTVVPDRDTDAAQKVGGKVHGTGKDSGLSFERKRQELRDAAAVNAMKKEDTTAVNAAVGKRTSGAATEESVEKKTDGTAQKETDVATTGKDTGGASEEKQKTTRGGKQTDDDTEREKDNGAGTDKKKTAEDSEEDEKEDNADRDDDKDDAVHDTKADESQAAGAGADQKNLQRAPDVNPGPDKTSGKDAYNDDDINYDDYRESDKNFVLDKAPRAGDNAAYDGADIPYDDRGNAEEQGREESNRWAEDDDDDEHYVADDDTSDGADADTGTDIKFAEHDAHEPSKDAEGSDTLRSTLLSFWHVLRMFCISCMLFSAPFSSLAMLATHDAGIAHNTSCVKLFT